MKKIYTIKRGIIIICVIIFLCVLFTLIGAFLLPTTEGILLCSCDVLFIFLLWVYVKKHCINYIMLSSQKVEHKKRSFSWDEVYITLTYTTPNIVHNAYPYRIYFDKDYLTSNEEVKKADKKGFCIDLDENRILEILCYYRKKIYILKTSPMQQDILKIITQHNENVVNIL